MKATIEALYDNVVLEPYEFEDDYQSTIIKPDMGKELGKFGKVIDIGPGKYMFGEFVETTLKVGDIVAIPPMDFIRFEVDNKEYYSGNENRILAKIKISQ